MGRTDGCTCFGVKTSSEVPVKRYNLLVPDIFPPIEPEYKKQLPNGVQRKIKKLGEYLEKYPERSEKVSRRLDRRLRKDLQSERYGHIQVAVHAYIQLLKGGQSAATQLSKELLGDEGDPASVGVVPLLLKHREPELRMWAVKIIAQFTNAQSDSRFKDRIEEFLDELCSMSYTTRDSLQDHSVMDETLEGMRVASLSALGELLGLNGRTQAIPQYLEQIEDCALENLYYHHDTKMASANGEDVPAEGGAAVAGSSREIEEPVFRTSIDSQPMEKPPSPTPLSNQPSTDAVAPQAHVSGLKRSETLRKAEEQVKEVGTKIRQSMVKMKTKMMDRRRQPRTQAMHADEMAADLLEDLAEFAQDSSTRRRVLENVFRFCDARQHWSSPDKIDACVSIFRKTCTEDHQYFVLFSSFVRHLASQRLSNVDRATLIKFAAAEGELQQSAFAAPSLVFALSELPQYLPHPTDSPDKVFLHTSILLCLRRLATALHDSGSVLEAVQTPLERLGQAATIALETLQCIEVAVSVVPSLPLQTHERAFPQSLLSELIVVVTSWRDTEARNYAHNMLQTILSCSALRPSQMESLLSSSWYQLTDPQSTPDVMVQVFATLNIALDGVSPEVAKHAVPFAIALHRLSLHKDPGGGPKEEAMEASPARRLACLLVADLLFERLSQHMGCPGLMDLSTGAEEHSNAVEVETPSSLHAAQTSFTSAHDNAAAASLASLAAAIEQHDEQLIAAQALSHGGVSDGILNPPWAPINQDKLCRPMPTASPNRFSSDRFMPRINPGEEVLRSLQANFASLAITTEDVLMTGAVGVGSLVEAAKQAAMETELALHHEPEGRQKRSFQQTVQSALPTSLALEVVLAEL